VLLNRYRDGRDNMGIHADDEPELGPDPVVATLSLGATRRMTLVPRRPRDGERRSLELPAGSLLVMRGACQRRFRHGIPREPRVTDERVRPHLPADRSMTGFEPRAQESRLPRRRAERDSWRDNDARLGPGGGACRVPVGRRRPGRRTTW
jgi:hypothetical protein